MIVFDHQHTIRKTGINRYLLYDNGNFSSNYTGNANVSRAVEYELDTINMTATKIWEFIHPEFSLHTINWWSTKTSKWKYINLFW